MKTSYIMYAVLTLLCFGCGDAGYYESEKKESADYPDNSAVYAEATEEEAPSAADTAINGYISSSAAKVNADTSRKFVRTANMKFKVKDVRKSTFGIEDIISKRDGFVSYTNLNSSVS